MKVITYIFLMLIALVGLIEAFPALSESKASTTTPFDAAAQFISVSNQHAFKPPGDNDLRGPCPALNAMANHNYLPHDGVATMGQFIDAQKTVFNVGSDLATILAIFGAVLSGSLESWSIGGPPPPTLLNPGLLVQQYGLSFSHNKYEGDSSATRGDLYLYGNDYKVVLDQFKALAAMQPDDGADFTFDVITQFRAIRLQESISQNPYFFAAPLPQIGAVTGGYAFIPRGFANHSAEKPDGYLDKTVLKSFFAITGSGPDNFKYAEGHEEIPHNWYKRSIPYDLTLFGGDLNNMFTQHPEFVKIGGNTGTTNSFTGVDLSKVTKGVYNTKDLNDPHKAMCFLYQFAFLSLPDTLQSLTGNLLAIVTQIIANLNVELKLAPCPKLTSIDEGEFAKFPGWKNLKINGTY